MLQLVMVRSPTSIPFRHAFVKSSFYADGMIIIWAQSANPLAGAYGSDIPPDEAQLDKEFWKPRTTFRYAYLTFHFTIILKVYFRCTTMQVYDLAWSPTGEYIIAGSTDNTARVFASVDGTPRLIFHGSSCLKISHRKMRL